MISSAGDRDEIKGLGLGLGLSSRRKEMLEVELEEGEACSYQNREDYDATVDPDVALSYIVRVFYFLLCSNLCFCCFLVSIFVDFCLFYFVRSMMT
jgi:hypothetical protein